MNVFYCIACFMRANTGGLGICIACVLVIIKMKCILLYVPINDDVVSQWHDEIYQSPIALLRLTCLGDSTYL